MKYRLDYVTNSSSSSFVCFGVNKDDIDIAKEKYLEMFDELVTIWKGKSWFFTEQEINNMTEEEKITYAEEETDGDMLYSDDLISIGGQNYDEVGIEIYTLLSKYPNEKIGDIKKIVAKELNKKFKTNFTEDDIGYFESGWYD